MAAGASGYASPAGRNPVIAVNGTVQTVTATPGSYATITRTWAPGDTITVKLPMRVVMQPANDNPNIQAITGVAP